MATTATDPFLRASMVYATAPWDPTIRQLFVTASGLDREVTEELVRRLHGHDLRDTRRFFASATSEALRGCVIVCAVALTKHQRLLRRHYEGDADPLKSIVSVLVLLVASFVLVSQVEWDVSRRWFLDVSYREELYDLILEDLRHTRLGIQDRTIFGAAWVDGHSLDLYASAVMVSAPSIFLKRKIYLASSSAAARRVLYPLLKAGPEYSVPSAVFQCAIGRGRAVDYNADHVANGAKPMIDTNTTLTHLFTLGQEAMYVVVVAQLALHANNMPVYFYMNMLASFDLLLGDCSPAWQACIGSFATVPGDYVERARALQSAPHMAHERWVLDVERDRGGTTEEDEAFLTGYKRAFERVKASTTMSIVERGCFRGTPVAPDFRRWALNVTTEAASQTLQQVNAVALEAFRSMYDVVDALATMRSAFVARGGVRVGTVSTDQFGSEYRSLRSSFVSLASSSANLLFGVVNNDRLQALRAAIESTVAAFHAQFEALKAQYNRGSAVASKGVIVDWVANSLAASRKFLGKLAAAGVSRITGATSSAASSEPTASSTTSTTVAQPSITAAQSSTANPTPRAEPERADDDDDDDDDGPLFTMFGAPDARALGSIGYVSSRPDAGVALLVAKADAMVRTIAEPSRIDPSLSAMGDAGYDYPVW